MNLFPGFGDNDFSQGLSNMAMQNTEDADAFIKNAIILIETQYPFEREIVLTAHLDDFLPWEQERIVSELEKYGREHGKTIHVR